MYYLTIGTGLTTRPVAQKILQLLSDQRYNAVDSYGFVDKQYRP